MSTTIYVKSLALELDLGMNMLSAEKTLAMNEGVVVRVEIRIIYGQKNQGPLLAYDPPYLPDKNQFHAPPSDSLTQVAPPLSPVGSDRTRTLMITPSPTPSNGVKTIRKNSSIVAKRAADMRKHKREPRREQCDFRSEV
ncbi:Uncharacterized protein Fot_35893 [Forsythia ovata]|uniref:Uncharacterized protein n=1 Tax=Forsythia ovata TaxID=205694 RepID=A0ABD1SMV2_9LAMI